jgi:hypothetical protein
VFSEKYELNIYVIFIRPETVRVSEGGNELVAVPGIEVSEECMPEWLLASLEW